MAGEQLADVSALGGAGLGVGSGQVMLDRVLRNAELIGDFLVTPAECGEGGCVGFERGETFCRAAETAMDPQVVPALAIHARQAFDELVIGVVLRFERAAWQAEQDAVEFDKRNEDAKMLAVLPRLQEFFFGHVYFLDDQKRCSRNQVQVNACDRVAVSRDSERAVRDPDGSPGALSTPPVILGRSKSLSRTVLSKRMASK